MGAPELTFEEFQARIDNLVKNKKNSEKEELATEDVWHCDEERTEPTCKNYFNDTHYAVCPQNTVNAFRPCEILSKNPTPPPKPKKVESPTNRYNKVDGKWHYWYYSAEFEHMRWVCAAGYYIGSDWVHDLLLDNFTNCEPLTKPEGFSYLPEYETEPMHFSKYIWLFNKNNPSPEEVNVTLNKTYGLDLENTTQLRWFWKEQRKIERMRWEKEMQEKAIQRGEYTYNFD